MVTKRVGRSVTKNKKQEDLEQRVGELTLDLQRTRADFENYRKRVDVEKAMAKATGRVSAISQLLPLIDTIDRAISHLPDDLKHNNWANGVVAMSRNIDKILDELGVEKIKIVVGETEFDPEFHEAVSMEEGSGKTEVISEELQSGYLMSGQVLRHAMVRVSHK
ncbi:nucleotide exchange factor GrpE [Candidatus Saccharibacteria bacterium]|nr:nucleotide exchange factor GrpE [Candidatus Saccharibacteria bacterium]